MTMAADHPAPSTDASMEIGKLSQNLPARATVWKHATAMYAEKARKEIYRLSESTNTASGRLQLLPDAHQMDQRKELALFAEQPTAS